MISVASVSDDEMQNLWAKVLSGEANSPGTYSKRTVNFLSDVNKVEAEVFSNLCGFGLVVDSVLIPLIFDTNVEIYNDKEINFSSLIHLESIGLIQFNHISGFVRKSLPKKISALYYDHSLELELENEKENKIEIGKVLFTQMGQELAPVCESKPVDGFFDYVKMQWKNHLHR